MKKILLPIFYVFLLSSCSKYYSYDIRLEKPKPSQTLTYENDTISIAFGFAEEAITFELYNKTEDGIKIIWDELSMSENGVAQRVVHKNTGITKITELQPPTTIPPKTKMNDELYPTSSLRFIRSSGSVIMVTTPIFPTTDQNSAKSRKKILSKKGQRISIFFPFYIRNEYHSMNFQFLIDDIQTLKSRPKKIQ